MIKDGITIAGNMIVDTNKQIKVYPNEGNLSYVYRSYQTLGGCVPNTSTSLRFIDNSLNIHVMGAIGDDEDGKLVKSFFEKNNINHEAIEVLSGVKTASVDAFFNLDNAKRTFFIHEGADAYFGKNLKPCLTNHIHVGYMLLLPYLDEHVDQSRTRMSYWFEELSSLGIKISCDMVTEESDRYRKVIASSLPYINYLIINEHEASRLAQIDVFNNDELQIDLLVLCAKVIKQMGVKDYIVIHSPMVSLIYDGEKAYSLPSLNIPGEHIKSSVGAGDAFCAGVLYGIIKHENPIDILRLASCVAADVLMSETPIPNLRGIEKFLELEKIYGRRKIC